MSASAAPESSLLVELLDEQGDLSAVERFSQLHADERSPLLATTYESLLPTTQVPSEGEQFAFRVDLDACTGCKACVTACHSLNGLDVGETWRRVGTLCDADPDSVTASAPQTVTTACHHCEDPGCLSGCPVKAYEKDGVTGIVRHLDDQCIGCKYCTLMCPYEVPQYDSARGIVRKCDMCSDRLAEGEAPACVQGCPNGAISIDVVPVGRSQSQALLPTVAEDLLPANQLTRPTTRYSSVRSAPVVPADLAEPKPREGHWPLVILTVGIQLSLGLFLLACAAPLTGASTSMQRVWFGVALAFGIASQGAAMFHLGRPQYAFRALLGLRTSWMSREIVALGGFVGGLAASFGLSLWPLLASEGWVPSFLMPLADAVPTLLVAVSAGTALLGCLGLYTQIMIYVATGRPFWKFSRTTTRFAGTALLLGAGASLALASGHWLLPLIALSAAFPVAAWKARVDDSLAASPDVALRRSGLLLHGPLASRDRQRKRLLAAGASMLLLGLVGSLAGAPGLSAALAALGTVAWLVAELLERNLFFCAEAMPGMPGQ